jgi:hypothetical protein
MLRRLVETAERMVDIGVVRQRLDALPVSDHVLDTLRHRLATLDDSNCLESQAVASAFCCHVVLVRIMALRIVRSLRMQAMSATFFGLPAARRRR